MPEKYKVSIKITAPDFELEKELELDDRSHFFLEQSREIYCADCGIKFPCRQESCSGDLVSRYGVFKLQANLPDAPIPKADGEPVRGLTHHVVMIDEAQDILPGDDA